MRRSVIALTGLMILAGCATINANAPRNDFSHEIAPPQPWPHENFDKGDEKFTFAIITDLNGGEREGVLKSRSRS